MKRSVIAALGAAVIATLGVSSAAQASVIGFDFSALNGSITHDGTSLSDSTFLDLDDATLLVVSVGTDDASGLIALVDTVTLTAETSPTSSKIIYGQGLDRSEPTSSCRGRCPPRQERTRSSKR
jgi:hypothetical protein